MTGEIFAGISYTIVAFLWLVWWYDNNYPSNIYNVMYCSRVVKVFYLFLNAIRFERYHEFSFPEK